MVSCSDAQQGRRDSRTPGSVGREPTEAQTKNEKIRELRARTVQPSSSSSATRRTNTGNSSPGQAGGRGRPRIYGGHDSVDPYPIVGPDKADVFVSLEESAG